MTRSSLHPECLNPPDDRCDVCGAQYYAIWASMFPGNMWTAKCSYIRKLLPPVQGGEYERRKEESIKQYFMLKAEGIVKQTLRFHQDVFYGLDRYIWEHWVGSHPSLVPCELHIPERVGFWDMLEGKVTPEHYKWGLGSRRNNVFNRPGDGKPDRIKDDEGNLRQFYYLAGNMIKWIGMYDEVPAQDSWVWDHFPVGQKWKEIAGVNGTNAINALVQMSQSPLHSAFPSNYSKTTFDEETLSHSKKTPVVVFYQITLPTGNTKKALHAVESQFDILAMGRFNDVTNSFDQTDKVVLYYTIDGGDTNVWKFVSDLCEQYSDSISVCRQVETSNTDFVSGESLRHLHEFCTAKPSFNVIHIANQLAGFDAPDSKERFNANKIQATTSALMTKMCLPSGDTCNVCGAEFYPLPFLHFTSNMFSASCDYVKKLMPPPVFEKKMYNITGDTYLAHLRKQFTTELFELDPQILGLHQHSIEHWIGGHPDLKPCDVAPMTDASTPGRILDRMKRYSWSLAPRRGSAPAGYLTGDTESNFRSSREVAFREYYYLAGNIFRWHNLYDKIPASDSWVWQWYPDGQTWEDAAKLAGGDAVGVIGKELSSDSGMEQFWTE